MPEGCVYSDSRRLSLILVGQPAKPFHAKYVTVGPARGWPGLATFARIGAPRPPASPWSSNAALARLLRRSPPSASAHRRCYSDDVARDVQILVLRHQLCVLGRGRRLTLRRRDRILLAAAGGLLPSDLWRSFPVSPQTVLRWHHELVKRKWTYRRRRRPGRPRIAKEQAMLILRPSEREPALGLPANPGRAEEARHPSLRNRHLLSASPARPPAGPSTRRTIMDRSSSLSRPPASSPATSSVCRPSG